MSEKEFLQLLDENKGIIYKVVNLYASDAEERKDLYQEILLQSWKGWSSFRGDAKFSTWLYRVSLNTVFTAKRKKSLVDFPEHAPEDIASGSNPVVQDDVKHLYAAIRRLAETDRALILLQLEGYNNSEIASMMGIAANSVNVKLFRVRERLAKMLKPLEE